MLQALATNNVDVVIMDAEAAKYWFTNNEGMYKLIGSQILLEAVTLSWPI